MIYDILCRDVNGNEVTVKFNNITSTVTDLNGKLLVPKTLTPEIKTDYVFDFDGLKFDGIRLLFGMKCNYNCKYCAEANTSSRKHKDFISIAPDHVGEFIHNLDKWGIHEPKLVVFRGGEPGVYIKLLAQLLPALRKKWPNAQFDTQTNGSLFSKKFARLMLETSTSVVISHDSYGQCERGDECLDDPQIVENINEFYQQAIERQRQQKWVGNKVPLKFHVTFNKVCTDPIKAVQYIREKVGFNVVVDWHPLRAASDEFEYNVDDDTLNDMSHNMLKACYTYDGSAPNNIYKYINIAIETFVRDDDCSQLSTYCAALGMNTISVDMHGRVFHCSNFTEPEDALCDFNKPETVHGLTLDDYHNRYVCQHCPWIHICRGCCSAVVDGPTFNKTCRNMFYFYQPIFCAAFERLYHLTPIKINGKLLVPNSQRLNEPTKTAFDVVDSWNLPTL